MNTMQAVVLYGKEDVRLEQVPVPSPKSGEVLIKIQSALTCGTDLKVFRRGYHARMIRPPALFGHEFSGIVLESGPGVTQWRPGTRVVAANSAPCRSCFFCQKNQMNLCEDLLFVNGAYAEYLLLPDRLVRENLLEIPEHLSFQAAALTEPLACVVRGIEAIQPQAGETAVLLGAGPIGLMFAKLLLHAGVRTFLVGKGKERLETAKRMGVESTFDLDELTDPLETVRQQTLESKGPDLVIEAVGRPEVWTQALALSRPGGRILLFGGCPEGTQVPLDTQQFHYGERSVCSVFHHTPEAIRKSLQLISEGVIDPKYLITQEAELQELPGILRRMLSEKLALKTAILPPRRQNHV